MAAAAGALVVSTLFLFWRDADFDDAFIVYRHARNLIEGLGWTYNPGEAHNASTSVLNTVLVALGGAALGSIPLAGHLVSAAGLALTGVFVVLLARPRFGLGLSACGALAIVTLVGSSQSWGLETFAFIGVCLWICWLDARGANIWFALGLAVLMRPDALLLAAIFAALHTVRRRAPPWAGLAQLGAVVAPWAIFSLWKFHQVFPSTLREKIWQGRSGYWGEGWLYARGLSTVDLGYFTQHWAGWLALAFVPAGVVDAVRGKSSLRWLYLFCLLRAAAYSAMNVPAYHWYYVLDLAVLMLAAFFGLGAALELAASRFGASLRRSVRGDLYLGSAAMVWAALYCSTELVLEDVPAVPLTGLYQMAAQMLERQAPPGSIAATEVGAIGFATHRPMLDIVGLTSSQGQFITGERNDLFFSARPAAIVIHTPGWIQEKAVFTDPRVERDYSLFRVLRYPGYERGLLLLVRRN